MEPSLRNIADPWGRGLTAAIERIALVLGCRIDATTPPSRVTSRAASSTTDCRYNFCSEVDYCGIGNSLDNPFETHAPAGDCLNKACFDHDVCYGATCVDTDSECYFSPQGDVGSCDTALLESCKAQNCIARDPYHAVIDLLTCAIVLEQKSIRVTPPTCLEPACGQESACSAAAGSCVGNERRPRFNRAAALNFEGTPQDGPRLATWGDRSLATWFRESTGATRDLVAASSLDGGVHWTSPTVIAGQVTFYYGSLAIGTSGSTWAALWAAPVPPFDSAALGRSYVSRSNSVGLSWADRVDVSGLSRWLFGPSIAARGSTWIATWSAAEGVGHGYEDWSVYAVRSLDDGMSWSSPVAVNDDASHPTYPSPFPRSTVRSYVRSAVQTNGHGTWLVAFERNRDDSLSEQPLDIAVARSEDDGLSWQPFVALKPLPGERTIAVAPTLASDGAAAWVVVYSTYTFDRSAQQIVASHSSDNGRTWSDPVTVGRTGPGGTSNGSLATDRAGTWVAAWSQFIDTQTGTGIFYATSSDKGASWTRPRRILIDEEPTRRSDGAPSIAVDESFRWEVAWSSAAPDTLDRTATRLYLARSR
ncbi:glycoside hydrolase [Candidatus Binatia bacterium]|nr:glycoside hydrolase [Candidatus Binatia bacterium]